MDNSACLDHDRAGMAAAIAAARRGIAVGQSPFGCAVVRDGRVLTACHNSVWRDSDPTRHAEVNAISDVCRQLATIDLSGCTLYATCEPCPMCFSAAHWARVSRVVFGAGIADAKAAGFNELEVPADELRRIGGNGMDLVPDFMTDECRGLFREWREMGRGRAY